jgi:twitching motility protein PilU
MNTHVSLSDNPLHYEHLLNRIIELEASDLYITYDSPPAYRIEGVVHYVGGVKFDDESIAECLAKLLTDEQLDDFRSTLELNVAIRWGESTRFRINVFRQQLHTAIVIRRIKTDIPSIEDLRLPTIYKSLVLQKRGLVLLVGATGSGKSTSLAAMIDYRNTERAGHIITIEDPIEFVHRHKKSIVSQRDVGIDTYSFGMALKNTLRQQPDVILIGEIRDQETMEHALNFAETGHLCLATLHANNSNQAIERILSFFPEVKHRQVMLNLALNLKGILSQRLIPSHQNKRIVAVEVLLNEGVMRELIREGSISQIKEMMDKNSDIGMQTFDKALFDLFLKGLITEENAAAYSDNEAHVRLMIMQHKQITLHASQTGTTISSNLPLGSGSSSNTEF